MDPLVLTVLTRLLKALDRFAQKHPDSAFACFWFKRRGPKWLRKQLDKAILPETNVAQMTKAEKRRWAAAFVFWGLLFGATWFFFNWIAMEGKTLPQGDPITMVLMIAGVILFLFSFALLGTALYLFIRSFW